MKVNSYVGGLLFLLCVWMQTGNLVRGQDCLLATFAASGEYDKHFDTTGLQDSYIPGSQVRVPCSTGYTGFFKINCLIGLGWVHEGTKCKPKPCGHPGEADDAEYQLVKGDDFVFGSEVEYTCNPGYQLVSRSNRRRCEVQGWDGFLPVCRAIQCPEVHVDDNMLVTGQNMEATSGHVLLFKCKQKHMELKGASQIYCEETGRWSAEPPTCKPKSCSPPAVRPKATFNLTKGDDFVMGSEVQYTCQKGYQVTSGSRKRTCTMNGWDGTDPTCDFCTSPVGIRHRNLISDDQLTASSSYDKSYGASKGRLADGSGWYAKNNDNQQWLQVDLKRSKTITGIITQGAKYGITLSYVTSFTVSYRDEGENWIHVRDDSGSIKVFRGNTDCCGYVPNRFNFAITARFVQVRPLMWSNAIAMRIELMACED